MRVVPCLFSGMTGAAIRPWLSRRILMTRHPLVLVGSGDTAFILMTTIAELTGMTGLAVLRISRCFRGVTRKPFRRVRLADGMTGGTPSGGMALLTGGGIRQRLFPVYLLPIRLLMFLPQVMAGIAEGHIFDISRLFFGRSQVALRASRGIFARLLRVARDPVAGMRIGRLVTVLAEFLGVAARAIRFSGTVHLFPMGRYPGGIESGRLALT